MNLEIFLNLYYCFFKLLFLHKRAIKLSYPD